MKTMKVWGVGPLWGGLVAAYCAAVTAISLRYSIGRIPASYSEASLVLGVLMLAVGVPYYVFSAKAVVRGFMEGRLVTDGVYRICRHPLYGSWTVFIIPGFELLLRSWLGLTTSIVAYFLLRMLVRREEDYLAEKFGAAYRQYRAQTPFVAPLGLFRSRSQ